MTTRAAIKDWIEDYDRDFDQWCQALMWRLAEKFGTIRSTPGSAIEAYNVEFRAGRIRTDSPAVGSFVYLSIGKYGHVGFVLEDGDVFWGTTHLQEEWGPANRNAGISTLDFYCRATGARVLGWSPQNGGNVVPFVPTVTAPAAAGPAFTGNTTGSPEYARGTDPAFEFWVPPKALQLRVQRGLKLRGRYSGALDGVWGDQSVKGIQKTVSNVGYTGRIDGAAGFSTTHHVQVYARKFGGYTGPIDNFLGPRSWEGFAKGLGV